MVEYNCNLEQSGFYLLSLRVQAIKTTAGQSSHDTIQYQ